VSTGGRPYRRLHLDEVDHLESVRPQQADPIAEAEVELDAWVVRPLEAMHAEIGPPEALRRRTLLFGIRDGEDPEGAVRQEDQLAAGAQEARGLGDPAVRIGPDRCPVLADSEVEACIGQSGRLGITMDEREVEVVLLLERARRAELLGRVVDTGRPSPAPRQPGRYIRRPAAELDDVHAGDIFREGFELGLRNAEDAPGDLVRRPRAPARFHVARRIDLVPLRAVARDVVGQVGFSHRPMLPRVRSQSRPHPSRRCSPSPHPIR
jgi:hypothetical protein